MAIACDCKKLGIAAAAAVILRTFLEFLTHEVWLAPVYHRASYLRVWNPEAVMRTRMPFLFLSHILYGVSVA
jgi:hypothetical protein